MLVYYNLRTYNFRYLALVGLPTIDVQQPLHFCSLFVNGIIQNEHEPEEINPGGH